MAWLTPKKTRDGHSYIVVNTLGDLPAVELFALSPGAVTFNLEGHDISRLGKLAYVVIGVKNQFTHRHDTFLIDFTVDDDEFRDRVVEFLREFCANKLTLKIVHNAKRLADCLMGLFGIKLEYVFDVSCYNKLVCGKIGQQQSFSEMKAEWGVGIYSHTTTASENAKYAQEGYWFLELTPVKIGDMCRYLRTVYAVYEFMKARLASSRPPIVAPLGHELPLAFLKRMNKARILAPSLNKIGQPFFTFADVVYLSQMNAEYLSICKHTRTLLVDNDQKAILIGRHHATLSKYERKFDCRILPITSGLLIFAFYKNKVNAALTRLIEKIHKKPPSPTVLDFM